MVVYARAKNLPLSPQKVRLVLDLIRGKTAEEARQILSVSPKKGARLISKVLASAVANAAGSDSWDNLRIVDTHADKAPVFKRWRARARGRGDRIIKRRTHLTVGVDLE